MLFKKILSSCVLISFGFGSAQALTTNQIDLSKKAIKLINEKKFDEYYLVKAQLRNTSIYPYLKYKEIAVDSDMYSQATIQRYYDEYNGQYWVEQLSQDLAKYYAEHNEWSLFNKYYSSGLGNAGKCWSMQSQYELGNTTFALNKFAEFWQDRVYMPDGCQQMEKYWAAAPYKADKYIVSKAYALAFAGKFDDALWLIKKNVKDNSDYVNYILAWQDVLKNPKDLDGCIGKYNRYRNFNDIFLDISKDMIKKDNEAYAKLWDNLKNKQLLNTKVKHETISMIAVSFARSQSVTSKAWLNRVDKRYLDQVAWEWILRVELYNGNYKGFIETYSELPADIQQESAWKYWLAYSYKKTGQFDKAKPLFTDLTSISLDYYSFLSSDELGKPYNFGNVSVPKLSIDIRQKLMDQTSVKQAVELNQIGANEDSINIWKWLNRSNLKANKKTDIRLLAQIAQENNMYYTAIFNMSILGEYSNIHLLFPLAFDKDVDAASRKYHIDKSLILSVMRKESLFDVDAGSWAGAKGLMQLTVPTAEFINRKYHLDLKYNDKSSDMNILVYDPYNNINMGTANLNFLDSLFSKNTILGLAAYNAGPGNVRKWLSDKDIPSAEWIENVPFGETRHYIRKILVYTVTYNNFVLGKNNYKISDFLKGSISNKTKS